MWLLVMGDAVPGLSVTDPVISKQAAQMLDVGGPHHGVDNGGGGQAAHPPANGAATEQGLVSPLSYNYNMVEDATEEEEDDREPVAQVPPPVVSGAFTKSHSMANFYYRRNLERGGGGGRGGNEREEAPQTQQQPQQGNIPRAQSTSVYQNQA